MTSFVLIVINLIVIKIYNPKPDTERMQALVQQYVEEMKKGVPPPANNQ
ncbi:MAG: hypothetical protein K2M43_02925 [Mycoplasmoidaceae bacterium]|nr:hypothetical protein [Mycoplasmoidaceae bacterium]